MELTHTLVLYNATLLRLDIVVPLQTGSIWNSMQSAGGIQLLDGKLSQCALVPVFQTGPFVDRFNISFLLDGLKLLLIMYTKIFLLGTGSLKSMELLILIQLGIQLLIGQRYREHIGGPGSHGTAVPYLVVLVSGHVNGHVREFKTVKTAKTILLLKWTKDPALLEVVKLVQALLTEQHPISDLHLDWTIIYFLAEFPRKVTLIIDGRVERSIFLISMVETLKKLTSDFGRLPKTVGYGLWPLTKIQIQRVVSTSKHSSHQNTNKDFFFNVEVVCILVVSRLITTDDLILILEDEPCASATIFSTNLIQQGLKSSKFSNCNRNLFYSKDTVMLLIWGCK